MAARPGQPPSMEAFDAYFRRADLDMDGRISGQEAVAFFQGSNLPKHILAQIWMYSDSKKAGFLNRQEFHNALKLVTVAQSGRELTPEIVKAALEGPAAVKIPPPQINPVAVSAPGSQMTMQRPPSQSVVAPHIGTMAPASSHNSGFRGPQVLPNTSVKQQVFPSTDGQHLRPNQADPSISSHSLVGQGIPGGGIAAASPPRPPNSNIPNLSTDWLSGRTGGASQVLRASSPSVMQDGFGTAKSGLTTLTTQISQPPSTVTSTVPPKPMDPLSSVQSSMKDSQAVSVSANGFSSESVFGGDMYSAAPHPKQGASTAAFTASISPSSAGIVSVSSGVQPSVRLVQNDPLQSSSTANLGSGQFQQAQSLVKQSQTEIIQGSLASTPSASLGTTGPASSPSERPWPKFSPSDIRKYSKVFVEVDKDRDGKITGEQARELFLSWRLPREILKQVWDLSDQDNDSMLSHREFVTALYLMERYREGYALPAVLPNSVRFDETLLQATGQPSVSHGGVAWQPNPGLPQQRMSVPRPPIPASRLRPQPQARELQQIDSQTQSPVKQKPSVPVLEKHLVNQLSKEEQDALNSKFQEAADADKKVRELEKEILDSKEKIEFYRTKMQELVLYKSRCDNRLNEITEKASGDKREVDLLAKKYEEKYKQVGDVASKLTVEEATFRDIQERKLELYHAIVKMEQEGSADGMLQVRADRIQSDLEALVKALNERCKNYGLRAKPTALIELPFGWQPGIQEGAADWDEDWDKFEDEGFAFVKELTVDVKNIIAPPKPKSSVGSDRASKDEVHSVGSPANGDKKLSTVGESINGSETADAQSEDGSIRSPPGSPPARSSIESPSQDFHSAQFGPHGTSPRIKESTSDHGGAESTVSGEKFADETSWGATFDTTDDADSMWDFNTKESDYERNKQNSFFDSGDFGLNPIRTDSPSAASVFGRKEKSPFFADSAPGTPLFNSAFSPRYEGSDDHSFDSFSRFDSFSMHDGGLFPPRENLARFDSIRSTADQSRMFSFDDADPFGSNGPFKSSESHTPRRGSDNWSAF